MGALAVVLMGYIVLGCGTVVTDTILTVPGATSNMRDIYGTTHWIFALVPHYCLGMQLARSASKLRVRELALSSGHEQAAWLQDLERTRSSIMGRRPSKSRRSSARPTSATGPSTGAKGCSSRS
eukprot:scaffold1414_cov384-Prasinococcus_capsulatus_cf.AAC.6